MIITPYIRMLDSDWLIAVIFFTNSSLSLWICRIVTSCRCICIRFNFFFMVFAKSYLPFLPFTETLVTEFLKRYQLCVLCNNRICGFFSFTETLVTKFVRRHQLCVLCNIIRSWKRQTKGIIYLTSVLNNIRSN
jgi:hypothetical protein